VPIPSVVPSAVQASAAESAAGRVSAPAPGFEAALASRLTAPASLPSVSLGHMVDALAGEPSAADAWGAASSRPAAVEGVGARVLAAGERYLGVPYTWGGTTAEGGFDCSGFVQQVYADLGVALPRVSVDQARAGTAVAGMGDARAGDLVFWRGDGSRPNHIGIYAGEGRMLVAPRTGDVVSYQQITRPPDAIRRVVG